MNIKKLNLVLIFTTLLTACSSDNLITEDNAATIENNQTKIGGAPMDCLIPEKPLFLDIKYIAGLTLNEKIYLRNKYRDFVGLECVIITSPAHETWIVDEDIYSSFCQICEDAQRCCRSEQMEEEEDVMDKVQLIAPIKL